MLPRRPFALACCLALAAVALAAAPAEARRYQPFSYTSDAGKVRICKGDTSTGDAICTNYANASADVTGRTEPVWSPDDSGTRLWLKYDSPFRDKGADLYRFFRYYNDKRQVRICVGSTATGQAICRDGTAYSASTVGSDKPKFEANAKAAMRWFKFFHWSKKARAGTYDFTTYRNDRGLVRVCRMQVDSGVTACQDYVAYTASTVGGEKPRWEQHDSARILYLRY